MTAFAIYLLKVTVCSGIMTGYYWLALRNKTFHRWNRFYLLASVVLSLAAPLLKINIGDANAAAPYRVFKILNVVATGDEVVVKSSRSGIFSMTAEQGASFAYLLVSLSLLVLVAAHALRIAAILRHHSKTKIEGIIFLNTHVRGTPFSFFHYIVWNARIDLASETGQRIFQHELAHVRQRHTWDKVFLLLLLIPCWANPVFWIIRHELHALHEFSADQKSVRSTDASELAQLILNTAFPQQHQLFTNPFFQSTIKRRIAMFTKLQNPSVSYAGRIIALPLLLIVVAAFSLKPTKPKHAGDLLSKQPYDVLKNLDRTPETNDTVPKPMYKNKEVARVLYIKDEKDEVEVVYKDGTKETIKAAEAKSANLLDADTTVLAVFTPPVIVKDTIPKRFYKNKTVTDVQYFEWPKREVHVFLADGTKEAITVAVAQQAGLFDSSKIARIKHKTQLDEKADAPRLALGNISLRKVSSMDEARNYRGVIVLDDKIFKGTFQQLPTAENEIAYISFVKGDAYVNEFGVKPGDSLLDVRTKAYIKANRRTDNAPLFTQPEVEPKFAGNWQAYLQKNLNADVSVKNGAPAGTYKVIIGFIVDFDGKLHDIKPLTKHGYGMEEEAVRFMRTSPEWTPATQNGKKVTAYKKQPITFVVSEGE